MIQRLKRIRSAVLIAFLVSAALAIGCPDPRECSSDPDCPRGEACFKLAGSGPGFLAKTVCARACATTADCLKGQECVRFINHGGSVAYCNPRRLEDGGAPPYSATP
jgi:hypothetical protein